MKQYTSRLSTYQCTIHTIPLPLTNVPIYTSPLYIYSPMYHPHHPSTTHQCTIHTIPLPLTNVPIYTSPLYIYSPMYHPHHPSTTHQCTNIHQSFIYLPMYHPHHPSTTHQRSLETTPIRLLRNGLGTLLYQSCSHRVYSCGGQLVHASDVRGLRIELHSK